jgi:hypothetical protein
MCNVPSVAHVALSSHCAPRTVHLALCTCTAHFALRTSHFALRTSHFALRTDRLLITSRLYPIQLRILPVMRHQLRVRTEFDELRAVEDDNEIRHPHC